MPLTQELRDQRAELVASGSGYKNYAPSVTHIPAGSAGGYKQPQPHQLPQPQPDPLAEMLAQQEAERAAREARIQQSISALNNIFGNRAPVYDRFADETFALNRDRLQDSREQAARQLKFALARAGLSGGSVDVDKSQDADDRYNRGLVDARSYADEQAAQMRAQDQQAKQQLLGVASSGGISSGQMSSMAQNALQGQQRALENPPVASGLGQVFSGLADTIGQALVAHGNRQGLTGPPGQDGFSSFFPNRRGNDNREEGTITSR